MVIEAHYNSLATDATSMLDSSGIYLKLWLYISLLMGF